MVGVPIKLHQGIRPIRPDGDPSGQLLDCFLHGRDPGLIGIHPYHRKAIYPVPHCPLLSYNQKECDIAVEFLHVPTSLQAGEGGELRMGYRGNMKLIQWWTNVQAPLEWLKGLSPPAGVFREEFIIAHVES